jgi:hypothetical protein
MAKLNVHAKCMDHLRNAGFFCETVEKYNPRIRRKMDLFGFADIIAVPQVESIIEYPKGRRRTNITLVQCTSAANMSHRLRKIESCGVAALWIRSGGHIVVAGLRKKEVPGKRPVFTWKAVEFGLSPTDNPYVYRVVPHPYGHVLDIMFPDREKAR